MIWSVFPAGVERGKTTDVTVYAGGSEGGGGGNLYRAYKALFHGEGVTAEIVAPDKGWPAPDPKKPNDVPVVDHVTMRVTVAPAAPLGTHEFRVGTPVHGVSTVGQLVVSDDREVLQQKPNNDIEHAQTVPVPCVVNGRLQDEQDVDTYKFHADAGQQIVFAVLCARLEDHVHDLNVHADPLLTLRDASGREIAEDDDYYGADPLLAHKFDTAGDYFVQLRDVNFQGNRNWVYRLAIATRPYVTSVVPCAVQPGTRATLHLGGYNLGGATTVTLDVPASTPLGVWETPLPCSGGSSNLVKLMVSTARQAAAPDPPPAASGAVTAAASSAPPAIRAAFALPGGVSGCLAAAGRPDRYAFHAKKGEPWGFEIAARRLDSEMDSELHIRNAKGDVLASNDDAIGKDSRIEWAAPEDGDYTVDVSDAAGNAGPTCFYNLTVERLQPGFTLRCDPDRAMVAPGNRTSWYVHVDRRYGFSGPVTLRVDGLPAGVTASPLTVPANVGIGAIVLSAADGAKPDTSLVRVVGTADVAGADGKPHHAERIARPEMELYAPGGGRAQLAIDCAGASVVERSDVEVTTATQAVTLAPGGTAKIEVTVKRRPGYAKPVTLDVMVQHLGSVFDNPLPPGVSVDDGASKTLIGENETKGYITLRAQANAQPVTDLPLTIMANVSINFVMKTWYSTPVFALTVPPKK